MSSIALKFLLVVLGMICYFLPLYLGRNKKIFRNIAIINIILGWTIIGWCFALILSIGDDQISIIDKSDVDHDDGTQSQDLHYSRSADRGRNLKY